MRWSPEKKNGPDLEKITGNWHYSSAIEYLYDSEYNCEEYGCDREGICRCRIITNARVVTLRLRKFSDEIIGIIDNEILAYCIDRIITKAAAPYVSNPENMFEVMAGGDYYGEEIREIKLNYTVASDLSKKINELLLMKSNRARIHFALVNEYGYLLSAIEKAHNWCIKEVDIEDIMIGQEGHYAKLDKSVIDSYEKYDLPRAVCLKTSHGKFKLIDGYHRIASLKKHNKKTVKIITNHGHKAK